MRCDELNSRFGAPGRIVFREGHGGQPEAVIASKYGTAEIALLGGNVLSYRPTGHGSVLFRPARRSYNRGEAIHGGIPVCWPQFGNRFSKDLPQHGFARFLVFEVRGSQYTEELSELTLWLKSDDERRKICPYDFDLELTISVSMKLNLSLRTTNTGTEKFALSCGFHPYFLLAERDAVTVRGLKNLHFFDGSTGQPDVVQAEDLKVDRALDLIYTLPDAPKHEFAVLDPRLRRALAMATAGHTRTVVWNPGPETKFPDLDENDWRKFVCVEPVSDWPGGRELAPGERYELMAAIQSTLEP